MRKVVLATYVQRPKSNQNIYDTNRDFYTACPEFLLDLTKALESYRKIPSSWHIRDPCQYHEHAKDEEKCPAAEAGEVRKATSDKSKSARPKADKEVSSTKESQSGTPPAKSRIGESKPASFEKNGKSGLAGEEAKGFQSAIRPETKALTDRTKSVRFEDEKGKGKEDEMAEEKKQEMTQESCSVS